MLHSIVAYTKEVLVFGHDHEIESKLQDSTPHDQLLIQTSESFSGCFCSLSVLCCSCGELALKGKLRILVMNGLGKLLGISCWLSPGFSFLHIHGGRSMIKGVENK
ncbi:hypothetical protein V6N11_042379 [Hibiscus sabdariffa]|uniref:DUF7865 domain-containing protein n=1 Tax=Hibiscus sabdariffa TaxID=183260 RepID=A0ABR2QWP6_9ROSI